LASQSVHVPGIYQSLLRRERERAARSRTTAADPQNPGAAFFLRSRHLLNALDAGEAVTVSASQLGMGSGEIRLPEHMRPGNAPGSWWLVTPDDVVERTVSPVVDPIRPDISAYPDDEDE